MSELSPTSRGLNQYTSVNDRFDAAYMPEPNSGCWIWIGAASPTRPLRNGGDMRPSMQKNGRRRLAYHVSYERFIGAIPEGRIICHKCNNSLCVNPDHIYAGTHQDNSRDCVAAGRHPSQRYPELYQRLARKLGKRPKSRAARPHRSILPHDEIPQMRARRDSGESFSDIAKTYGVTRQGVFSFLKRDAERAALLSKLKEDE